MFDRKIGSYGLCVSVLLALLGAQAAQASD